MIDAYCLLKSVVGEDVPCWEGSGMGEDMSRKTVRPPELGRIHGRHRVDGERLTGSAQANLTLETGALVIALSPLSI